MTGIRRLLGAIFRHLRLGSLGQEDWLVRISEALGCLAFGIKARMSSRAVVRYGSGRQYTLLFLMVSTESVAIRIFMHMQASSPELHRKP